MNMKLIAPFSAILFGLSACTYVEDGPYVSYQAQFAVGGPLYYSAGPVTWRYYDGYTYHLYNHHGQFVGYAYYDYDHYYRIADLTGAVVYFLRWSSGSWRIENHRGHHLGFIHSDNRGNHWIADTHGRRHGGMQGWGRSGSHGHAHAGRHDDRVEHRESRHLYNTERDRWRNKGHDQEIRQRQEHVTHSVGREDSRRRSSGHDNEEDRRRNRRDDRDRGGQRDHGVNITPVPSASHGTPVTPRKANQPRRDRDNVAVQPAQNAAGSPKAKKVRRNRRDVRQPSVNSRAPAARQPRAATPKPQTVKSQAVKPKPQAVRPKPQTVRPQAVKPKPQAVKPKPQAVKPKPQAVRPQAVKPKPSVKPAKKPAKEPKGKKAKEDAGDKKSEKKKNQRERNEAKRNRR